MNEWKAIQSFWFFGGPILEMTLAALKAKLPSSDELLDDRKIATRNKNVVFELLIVEDVRLKF